MSWCPAALSNDRSSLRPRAEQLASDTSSFHPVHASFWQVFGQCRYPALSALSPGGRRFDAAHELAHLVMHRHVGSGHPNAEAEADAFASAFLMPPADLRAEIPRVRSLNDIIVKKRRYGVSAAALAYTLHKAGRISDWTYRGFCIELGKHGRSYEPNPMPREVSQVWTKVLTHLWRQGVSVSRLAQQLDLPEREINALLFGIAAPPVTDGPGEGSKLHLVS